MRNKWKGITWILVVTLLCRQLPIMANAQEGTTQEETSIASEMTMTGDNSFGTMLANELSSEMSEQKENNGCNVFSVEMQGESAVVSFESVEDAVLVVGIYDETGTELLTSGSMEIYAGETATVIDFETGSIPQYFYIKGYLIEPMTYRPLCTVYESPMYTQEMQEFLAKTTADFETERVLNLDEDESNNFAVYSEDTILISGAEEKNEVTSVDENNNVYVIENADSSIMELQPGDIFAYPYQENEVLIVKVAGIAVDGTTVTITGADASMEEVFDYIKIDTEMGSGEATVDASSCGDGVIYEGMVDYVDEGAPQTYGLEVGGNHEKAFKLKLEKDSGNDINLSGGLEMKLNFSAKVYVSFTMQYMELKFDYSAKVDAAVSAGMRAELPLVTIGFMFYGIIVELTPSIIVEANASVSVDGTLSGTVGFRAQVGSGIINLTTHPKFDTSLKVEGSVYVGFSLCPRVKILSEKVAAASLTAEVGAEVKASLKEPNAEDDENKMHACAVCFKGEVNGAFTISAKVEFLSAIEMKFDAVDMSVKIADFYYSADYSDLGWSTCPYYLLRGEIVVLDTSGSPIQGVQIETGNDTFTTNGNGCAEVWLSTGKHILEIRKEGYQSVGRMLLLEEGGVCLLVRLEKIETGDSGGNAGGDTGAGGSGDSGDEGENEETILEKVIEQVSLGVYHSAVLTEAGDLYLWGDNRLGQLGDGTVVDSLVPKKIMSGVKTVELGDYHSAAITEQRELYLWGDNGFGELGDGTGPDLTESDGSLPKKIMSGVKAVSLGGYHSAAITEEGDLYLWGHNGYGQLGDGTSKGVSSLPKKIMSDVKTVSLGETHSAAITENGDLYLWGYNADGELGDGTEINGVVPKKIMSGIKAVSLGGYHSAAITEEGDLYLWGSNYVGQMGDGTGVDNSVPKKIMGDVKAVSLGGYHSAAITEAGDLYLWGSNLTGQLGDETKGNSLVPKKIMSGVKEINLGALYSAAITEEGDLYLWGHNEEGQLGNGTTTNSYTPIKITIPSTTEAVSKISLFSTQAINENSVAYDQASNWNGANFANLTPNETYNYYIMQDRDADQPFTTENLSYIGQAVADGSGNLSVTFSQEVATSGGDIFAVPMNRIDLSGADVSVADLIYNGMEQYAEVLVRYGDTLLVEGKDYNVKGSYGVTQVGEYTLTLEGIGLYTGFASAIYQMVSDEFYSNITGTVTSYGDESKSTTLNLYNNETAFAGTSVVGNNAEYTLENILPGTYTMQVSKENHVTREYNLTVNEPTLTQNVEIRLLGDIVGDGVLNAKDKKILYNYIASAMPTEAYDLAVADVNSDGSVNAKDKKMLYNHIAGISLLW